MGRTPNTLKSAMIRKCILEEDPKLQIEPEDFSEEADSTILVRERVRGTKLEGNFKKMKGRVTAESEHAITVQPKAGKPIILSKRDVAKVNEGASTSALRHNEGASTSAPRPIKSKKAKKQKVAAAKIKPFWEEMAEKSIIEPDSHQTRAEKRKNVMSNQNHKKKALKQIAQTNQQYRQMRRENENRKYGGRRKRKTGGKEQRKESTR